VLCDLWQLLLVMKCYEMDGSYSLLSVVTILGFLDRRLEALAEVIRSGQPP
jgi:hypothetical protein